MCTGSSETFAPRPPVRAVTAISAFAVGAAERETDAAERETARGQSDE
jgi:hypothetical protein